MRIRFFAGLALGAFGILAIACTNKVTPAYPDTTSFCAGKAKAICQVADLCAIDAPTCQAYQDGLCNQAAQQAMASGTRNYNADNAKACIDAVTAAYGNGASKVEYMLLSDLATKCDRVFTGNAPSHASCTSDYYCANDLICSPTAPDVTTRVCATPTQVAANDFCSNPGSVCATDTYCAKQASNGLWLCSPAAATGAACGDATPCVSSQRCVSAVCQPRATGSGNCASDGDCAPAFPYCDTYAGSICTIGLTFATGAPDCKGIAGLSGPVTTPDAGAGGSADASGQ
jgi:hypothetical protein